MSMEFFNSMSDLAGFINVPFQQTIRYSNIVAVRISDLAILMKTCKGRDKVCSLIQYLSHIYCSLPKNESFSKNHYRA